MNLSTLSEQLDSLVSEFEMSPENRKLVADSTEFATVRAALRYLKNCRDFVQEQHFVQKQAEQVRESRK